MGNMHGKYLSCESDMSVISALSLSENRCSGSIGVL